MIHKIIAQTFGAAGSEAGTVANQNVNGLVISKASDWHASDYITVVLKSKYHAPKVLVNRLPMEAVAGISGLLGGQDRGLQSSLNGLTTTDYVGYAAFIPLGCIKMQDNDSTLEVTYEAGEASTVDVSCYFNDDDTDLLRSWMISNTLTDTLQDVDGVFLFTATEVVDPSGEDLSVMIQGPSVNSIASAQGLFGFSAAVMASAGESPQNVVVLYDSADGIHDAVTYQVTGSDAANYSVISSHVERNPERVSRGTIGSVGEIIKRVRVMDPAKARGLRRAGILPARGGLETALDHMNIKG